jgi:hypothetical protein
VQRLIPCLDLDGDDRAVVAFKNQVDLDVVPCTPVPGRDRHVHPGPPCSPSTPATTEK